MGKKLLHTDIINLLKEKKAYLYKEYGVVNIGLFGSYVSGRQADDSDIDILVEMKEPRFDLYAGLQLYLESKFDKKIELIRKSKKYQNRFIKKIEKNIIYA